MSRNLDVTLLRTFVAVADLTSMTAAGNRLSLTQSAVSQQIARLEEVAGRLFLRDRRALRLTSSGQRLLPKARRMVALNDELWAEMNETSLVGPLRLGVPYDLVGAWVTPILKEFCEEFPLVEVSLSCRASPELLAATASGQLDLALIEEPVGPTGGECLAVERLVWVGARNGSAHLRSPVPISLVAETCAFRPAVLGALESHGVAWRTMFESGSIDATRATVRADLAITAWLRSTVPPDLDIVAAGDVLPELPPFAVNLHRTQASPSPAAAELAGRIRRAVSQRA
jgi:DNA-binding transcriptional LysR family regulator